jgi:ribosomal protein L35
MPKMKSKGAVKKRFKISKNGKALCSRPGRGHMHAPYDGKVRRKLRQRIVLNTTWSNLIRRMMEA